MGYLCPVHDWGVGTPGVRCADGIPDFIVKGTTTVPTTTARRLLT